MIIPMDSGAPSESKGRSPGASTVKLPHSGGRNEVRYCKLLWRVRKSSGQVTGFDFEGQFLRSGKTVRTEMLRPSVEYPEKPLVLECVGQAPSLKTGVRHVEMTHILWRLEGCEWVEIAKANSFAGEWLIDLAHIVQHELERQGAGVKQAPDYQGMTARIAAAVDKEMETLDGDESVRLLSLVHDMLGMKQAKMASSSVRDGFFKAA